MGKDVEVWSIGKEKHVLKRWVKWGFGCVVINSDYLWFMERVGEMCIVNEFWKMEWIR